MMSKINHKIKSLSIELDKNTKLKELNGIIKNFKETTDSKYEVTVHVTFTLKSGTLILFINLVIRPPCNKELYFL